MKHLAPLGYVIPVLALLLANVPLDLCAQSQGVVFWNTMEEILANGKLDSAIGADLNLNGTDWSFRLKFLPVVEP